MVCVGKVKFGLLFNISEYCIENLLVKRNNHSYTNLALTSPTLGAMAKLKILMYPDPRLRRIALPVTEFDDELAGLVADMAETMYSAPGIGLAAVQVNVPKRVVVIDISEEKNDLQVFINPEIFDLAGKTETEEGCLSVPGVFAMVGRARTVTIKARGVKGRPFDMAADEMLSVCIQHEIDHLNGKVFVDHLSRMKQGRIRKKLRKEAQAAESEAA